MSDVIWKAFKIGSIFERSTKLALSINQKDLNLVENKDNEHSVALISASRDGSGRVGYIENDLVKQELISKNKITFDDQWGYTFFQQEDFVITGGHNAILEIKDNYLKHVLDLNLPCYSFISLILNHITIKSEIYGYGYKINNKLDREIILLPCLEVPKDEEHIWEENGHCYTLAVDYIKELMDKAKEEREKNTIRLYEAERAKYEAERSKYEEGYKKEKELLVWKGFKLGDLFEWSSRKDLSLKNYNFTEKYEDGYVEVVTGSKTDNNEFIAMSDLPSNYPVYHNCLCLNTNGSIGFCIYYDRNIISPTSSVHILLHKLDNLEKLMTKEINQFFSQTLTKIFTTGIYSRTACLISEEKFDREVILLPCLEVPKDEEHIWEENGHCYTLAVDYISYLYLSGKVNYNQKLIDTYTYSY